MASGTSVLRVILEMVTGQYVAGAKTAATETGKLADSVGTTSGKFGALQGAMRLAVGSAALAQVGQFVGQSIQAFSKLNESTNAVGVVFGDAKDTILDFAKTAAEQTGLAESEFNQLATTTGAMLTNFGLSAQDAAEETINLTQRAADMASVFNVDVNEAMTAIQAALRGESEPIRRFGVSLDDATVKAKAVAMGLAESTGAVDNQAKAAARLQIIYEQTNKVAGDFVNTSDGLANKQRILQARLENTKAKIGERLTPAMLALLDVVEDLSPQLETMAGNLADVAADAGKAIGPLGDLLGLIQRFTGPMDEWSGSNNVLVEGFGRLFDFLDPLETFGRVYDDFINLPPVKNLMAALNPIPDEVHDSWKTMGTVLTKEDQLLKDIAESGPDAAEGIKKLAPAAKTALEQMVPLATAAQNLVDAMLKQADPIFSAVDAMESYNETVKTAAEDGVTTAIEQLDILEARLKFQATLSALGGGNLERGIDALATAWGKPRAEVEKLLEVIGILDGKKITVAIDLQVPTAIREGGTFQQVVSQLAGGGPGGTGIGRAHGGPVTAGQAYTVGERGPETFMPHTSGRIIPNGQPVGAGGGNVTVNVISPTTQNLDRDLAYASLMAGLMTQVGA